MSVSETAAAVLCACFCVLTSVRRLLSAAGTLLSGDYLPILVLVVIIATTSTETIETITARFDANFSLSFSPFFVCPFCVSVCVLNSSWTGKLLCKLLYVLPLPFYHLAPLTLLP